MIPRDNKTVVCRLADNLPFSRSTSAVIGEKLLCTPFKKYSTIGNAPNPSSNLETCQQHVFAPIQRS